MLDKIIEVQQLADELLVKHELMDWQFKFDSAKHRIGQCRYGPKEIGLSISYVEKTSLEELKDTILHEIAHALVGNAHGHDEVWKDKCLEIGAKPYALADESAVSSAKPNFVVECESCGMRWKRFRLKKRVWANARCSCGGQLKFYKVKKG